MLVRGTRWKRAAHGRLTERMEGTPILEDSKWAWHPEIEQTEHSSEGFSCII